LAAVAPDLARWKLGLATNEEAKTALLRKSLAGVSAAEIEAAGGAAIANADSVANPEGAKRMVQAAIDQWGRVDILVNNAGILRDRTI